jgi:hypothetical protein
MVHEHWGDNLYLERRTGGTDIEAAARAAEDTVTRHYRMNRQSGAPLMGRAAQGGSSNTPHSGTDGSQTHRWRGMDFELPVPRAMHGRPKAIIADFGRRPPPLVICDSTSADITEGGPKRSLGTEALAYRARNRKFESISLQRRVSNEPCGCLGTR